MKQKKKKVSMESENENIAVLSNDSLDDNEQMTRKTFILQSAKDSMTHWKNIGAYMGNLCRH